MTPEIVLTPHFIEQTTREDGMFSAEKWWQFREAMIRLAKAHVGEQCLATVGRAKFVFVYSESTNQVTFITCMPKDYKHNAFQKARTVNLGTLEDGCEA